MRTKELVADVAERTGLSRKRARETVGAVFDAIAANVREGPVKVVNFGSFEVVRRAAKAGYNPAMGERIAIPERNAVRFRPAAALKKRVGGDG